MENPAKNILSKIPPKARTPVIAGGLVVLAYIAYKRREADKEAANSNGAVDATTPSTAIPATTGIGSAGYQEGNGSAGGVVVIGGGGSDTTAQPGLDTQGMFDSYSEAFNGLAAWSQGLSDRVFNQSKDTQDFVLAKMEGGTSGAASILETVLPYIPTPSAAAPVSPQPVQTQATVSNQPSSAGPAGFPIKGNNGWYRVEVASKAGKDSNNRAYKKGDELHVYSTGRTVKDN